MKMKYETPRVEIIDMQCQDIIVTSGSGDWYNNEHGHGHGHAWGYNNGNHNGHGNGHNPHDNP